jgi:hypothetical protein
MNNMHHAAQITNGMLYDLIRDMKDDINRRFEEQKAYTDRRFEIIDDKFRTIDDRFRIIDDKFITLINQVEKNTNMLEEIHFNRDKTKVTFSRTFAFSTMFFSSLIAYLVALFNRN